VLSPYVNLSAPETIYKPRFDLTFYNQLVLADIVDGGGQEGLNGHFPEEVKQYSNGLMVLHNTYSVLRQNHHQLPTQFRVTDINGKISDVSIRYTRNDVN